MIDLTQILQFMKNPEVVLFISTYIATKGLDEIYDGIKSKYSTKTMEYQLLTCLEKALSQTCDYFGWEYDSKVISETFFLNWKNIKTIDSAKSLSDILERSIGNPVNTVVLEYWADSFYKAVAKPENSWLHNYLMINKRNVFGNAMRASTMSQQYFVDLYSVRKLFLEKEQMDGIRLSDVYVLPEYEVRWFSKTNENSDCSLVEFILEFISEKFPFTHWSHIRSGSEFVSADAMFIFGLPGIGKTSLVAHLIQLREIKEILTDSDDERKIFTIRLREFNKVTERNPVANILEYLNSLDDNTDASKLSLNDMKNSLFILDGLDELCAIHGISGKQIKVYCDNILRSLKDMGGKIIITSRLNVLDIDNYASNDAIVVHLKPFSNHHRKMWFDKYIHMTEDAVSDELYDNIINENDSKKEEILGIPLILYMIASLKLNPTEMTNLGNLYDRLFEELKARQYNIANKTHAEIKLLDDSKKLARMYARKMFEQRSFVLNGIIAKETILDFIHENKIDISRMDINEIERNYAVSFYYSKIRPNQLLTDKVAVEFVHRSIQEYLMADVIWDELCKIQEKKESHELFELIGSLFGKSKLTREIAKFMRYRLTNPVNQNNPHEYKNHLEKVNLVGEFLKKNFGDFLRSDIFNASRFSDEEEFGNRPCNMFYSYWDLLRAFFVNCSPLNIDDSVVFSKYLRRLSKLENAAIDLSYVTLINADLNESSLKKACFDKSFLINVNFDGADLSDCSFREAELYRCEFIDGCYLPNVSFFKAKLVIINFMYSVGSKINFDNTFFLNCAINEADFMDIDWRQSTIENSSKSNLSAISFSLCHLTDLLRAEVDISKLKFYNEDFTEIDEEVIKKEVDRLSNKNQ